MERGAYTNCPCTSEFKMLKCEYSRGRQGGRIGKVRSHRTQQHLCLFRISELARVPLEALSSTMDMGKKLVLADKRKEISSVH